METANKLYVFVPGKNWNYCSGAQIICANSPEEAVELANWQVKDDKERWDKHLESVKHKGFNLAHGYMSVIYAEGGIFVIEDTEDNRHKWVIQEIFVLAESRSKGVVLSQANYA